MIDRGAHRLDGEDIGAAYVFLQFDPGLAVAPKTDFGAAKRSLQLAHDLRGEHRMGRSREDLQTPVHLALPYFESVSRLVGKSVTEVFPLADLPTSDFRLRPEAIDRAGTPTTVAPFGTSLVTTDPAPVRASSPMLIGARSMVSLPMKARAPMAVWCFCAPSKLAVTVPAPILVSAPTAASPM